MIDKNTYDASRIVAAAVEAVALAGLVNSETLRLAIQHLKEQPCVKTIDPIEYDFMQATIRMLEAYVAEAEG